MEQILQNALFRARDLADRGEVNSRQVPRVKRCQDCEEDRISEIGNICLECGSQLVIVERRSQNPEVPVREQREEGQLTELFALFGLDGDVAREFLRAARNQEEIKLNPISKTFLSTLGRVEVNSRQSILYDCYMSIGSLQILAVPAAFSWLPTQENMPFTVEGPLVLADPCHAEGPLSSSAGGAIVIAKRGVSTFAKKLLYASAAGAKALVVVQTANYVFPFEMADSSKELERELQQESTSKSVECPIVMVSASDGALLENVARTRTTSSLSSASSLPPSLSPMLRMTKREKECAICQDDFECGHRVLRLPCRHTYHDECVTKWLEQHSSCPVCRREMPSTSSSTGHSPGDVTQPPHHDTFTN